MNDAQLPMVDPFRPWPALAEGKTTYSRRRIIRTALLKALDEDIGGGTRAIDAFAKSMVSAAIDGSVDAAKFVADRIDGKVPLELAQAGGDDNAPIVDEGRMLRALALLVEELKLRDRAIEIVG